MDLFEYELAGIVPVLLFFAFIWTAVLAGGILMIVLSARRKQKRLLGCGVVFLAIAVGIPLFGLLMFLSSVFGRRAACGANGISGTVLTGWILAATGAIGCIAVAITSVHFRKKYATPVEATCIDAEHAVYECTINGEKHTLTREINWSRSYHPTVGETRTLYISERDLTGFYDPQADRVGRILVKVFLGIVFLAVGALSVFLISTGR